MDIGELRIINEKQKAGPTDAPTTDDEVRKALRNMGEPVTYFGEDKADRRARLIDLLNGSREPDVFAAETVENMDLDSDNSGTEDSESDNEEFYTPGTDELLEVRKDILAYSLVRAQKRISNQKEIAKGQNFVKTLKYRRSINSKLAGLELYGSQSLATRALSRVRYAKSTTAASENGGQDIAVGSWDGSVHILNGEDLSIKHKNLGKHMEKVSALDWSVDNSALISGGGEGSINLWNIEKNTNESIESAHAGFRITDTRFHQSGKYFASTSFDQTWKLWDTAKLTAIYQQEGHSKEVYCSSFHPDGGLFATAGLDAIGRVWDLRSGRSISVLEGHIKGIYGMDWSPNGVQLATASGDCSVKIWDMRQTKLELFSIPAHKKLVSDVKFLSSGSIVKGVGPVSDENGENPERLWNEAHSDGGSVLVTSSYDGEVNLWSADSWIKIKTLAGHNDKVMSCDISQDGSIATCGWDRTVKLWKY